MNAQLRVTRAAMGRLAQLRADGIRTADLVQLGRVLAAGDDRSRDLLDALEGLGRIADDAYEGEISAAVADIETHAGLQAAVMDLTPGDVGQLAAEAWAALPPAAADEPAAPKPSPDWVRHTEPTMQQQRDRRAS